MKYHRLPDGKLTKSTRRYLREWNLLVRATEDFTGGCVYAFDPDIAVCQRDGSGSCSLPLWIVRKFAKGE